MAVGPRDYIENYMKAIKEFEDFIDAQLNSYKFKPYDVKVIVNAPPNMTESHFDTLKHSYERAGWESVIFNQHFRKSTILFRADFSLNR